MRCEHVLLKDSTVIFAEITETGCIVEIDGKERYIQKSEFKIIDPNNNKLGDKLDEAKNKLSEEIDALKKYLSHQKDYQMHLYANYEKNIEKINKLYLEIDVLKRIISDDI